VATSSLSKLSQYLRTTGNIDDVPMNYTYYEQIPNTLQDHMATMLREWSGIDRASSHSGRRTLSTNLLHDQGEHLKTVQKVLGHKSAATTTIYQDVTEQEVKQVLKKAGKNYDH
jgi:site-specific recombinase XerD